MNMTHLFVCAGPNEMFITINGVAVATVRVPIIFNQAMTGSGLLSCALGKDVGIVFATSAQPLSPADSLYFLVQLFLISIYSNRI